jgi:hypothetical protein
MLDRITDQDRIRLAGVHAHHLERPETSQLTLFDGWQTRASKACRLNRALDLIAEKFGADALTRGLVRADRAAPSRRLK